MLQLNLWLQVKKLREDHPKLSVKHLDSELSDLMCPVASTMQAVGTGLIRTQYSELSIPLQIEVAMCVFCVMKNTLRQAAEKCADTLNGEEDAAPAEAEEDNMVAPTDWADKAFQLPCLDEGQTGQDRYDRVMAVPEDQREAEFNAIKEIAAPDDWVSKAAQVVLSADDVRQYSKLITAVDDLPRFWAADLHTPIGDPGKTQKKKSTDVLYPASGEYAVVDPCNYVFEFVVGTLIETIKQLQRSVGVSDAAFTACCIKTLRVVRLATLNLNAWQEKRDAKKAEGKAMSSGSVPSLALQTKLFDVARQALTCLEKVKDHPVPHLPKMLYQYGEAFLRQASTYYYTNAQSPSKLLMEVVAQEGVGIAEGTQPLCEGSLPISSGAGRAAVDAMCANINSAVAAAKLFSEGSTKDPLESLDNTDKVLPMVSSFLDLLSTDLHGRLAGDLSAEAPMPITAAVVAQLQMGLWARNSTNKKDVSSVHHYAIAFATKAADDLNCAAGCSNKKVLSQTLNRSVFALILPAFSVLCSKLQWDLSKESHVENFGKWLAAASGLAAAIEAVTEVLPNPNDGLSGSLTWEVVLPAGINVRVEPSLKGAKKGLKLLKGAKVAVTETKSEDGEWVLLDNYEGHSDCWVRFKKPTEDFMTPALDEETELSKKKDDPSCGWLSTSLSVLLYHVGQQTFAGEEEKEKDEPAARDTSPKWLESSLVMGGPTAEKSKQLEQILDQSSQKDLELRLEALKSMAKSFEPEQKGCPWWGSCLAACPDTQETISKRPPSGLEEKAIKAVFTALLRHAGLSAIPESGQVMDEVMKCFHAAVDFAMEIRGNNAHLEEANAATRLRAISFRAEFLQTSLEPALRPLESAVFCHVCCLFVW